MPGVVLLDGVKTGKQLRHVQEQDTCNFVPICPQIAVEGRTGTRPIRFTRPGAKSACRKFLQFQFQSDVQYMRENGVGSVMRCWEVCKGTGAVPAFRFESSCSDRLDPTWI